MLAFVILGPTLGTYGLNAFALERAPSSGGCLHHLAARDRHYPGSNAHGNGVEAQYTALGSTRSRGRGSVHSQSVQNDVARYSILSRKQALNFRSRVQVDQHR